MNKLIAFILCFLLIFGTVPYALAETAVTNTDVEDPYSTLNLVKQLRENPLVEDIWVPVLKEKYQHYSFIITPNGTYYYDFATSSGDAVRVTIVQNKHLVSLEDERVPYQMYLIENDLPLGTINQETAKKVSENTYKLRQYGDNYIMYLYQNVLYIGNYKGYQAAFFVWMRHVKTNLTSLSNTCSVMDTTLALTPHSMASVMCTGSLPNKDYLEALENRTDISFVTSGDVDGNYKVNAKDALAILKHGVGKQLLEDELALLLADCDKNDIIDAADALFTLRKAVFK